MSNTIETQSIETQTDDLINCLSQEEIDEILADAAHYEQKQAAAIEALKIVQRYRGWVSDESIKAIARLLEMSADQLDGVATFYNLIFRRPVGKNVLMLCDSVSCWMLGCESIRAQIKQQLGIDFGETTADKEYTLLPVPCQGACDRGPVMLKNMQLHGQLSPSTIGPLINRDASSESNND